MSTEQMEQLAQHFYDMINIPDINIADKVFASDFVAHLPMMPMLDCSGYKACLQSFYDAFPDLVMEINDSIMTGTRLVLRVTYYGTHDGNFLGISATGCQVTMPGICIFRIEGDLVSEKWMEIDVFGVLRQISGTLSPAVVTTFSRMN
jgi:predicted ester cyclase